ncbi:MAG: aminotransferase class V-fold PLP-dependent enzyme [Clostridiales bacterium]|jgi:cysteine desulfurase|nr:aminotransferase class V-fold PLP-dependent enzyme [Clostridiales bacterium]
MIYLDNAATMRPNAAALAAVARSVEIFANPSSLHAPGLAAEKEINAARAAIAAIIGAAPAEIYFTSGGTESNNLAIFGGAKKHKGRRIVTLKGEHPSISEPLAKLAARGDFEICYDMENFSNACLATLSHVNSETGEIADIQAIGKAIKKQNPGAIFHVDACQSFCKIPINVRSAGIDLLTLSAHKIGGIKGCGALFVRQGISLAPLILGGGQEGGLRSGTENVPGILAFAAAAKHFWQNSTANFAHVAGLKKRWTAENRPNESPYILSLEVDGIAPHVILNALSAKGIHVSTGAACSAKKKQKTGEKALRISFSPENTPEEIDRALEEFGKCIEKFC